MKESEKFENILLLIWRLEKLELLIEKNVNWIFVCFNDNSHIGKQHIESEEFNNISIWLTLIRKFLLNDDYSNLERLLNVITNISYKKQELCLESKQIKQKLVLDKKTILNKKLSDYFLLSKINQFESMWTVDEIKYLHYNNEDLINIFCYWYYIHMTEKWKKYADEFNEIENIINYSNPFIWHLIANQLALFLLDFISILKILKRYIINNDIINGLKAENN